jgi:hypothetical protein
MGWLTEALDTRWGPQRWGPAPEDAPSTQQERNRAGRLSALQLAWTKRGIRWDTQAVRAAEALIAGDQDPAVTLIRSRLGEDAARAAGTRFSDGSHIRVTPGGASVR